MSSSESSRRRGRDHDCHDTAAAAKRPRRSQKHLYLVMDDWEKGYSIHKVDVDELASSDAGGAKEEPRRLPEPCALRIEVPEYRCPAVLASLGSKIFLLTDRFSDSDDAPPLLIYDTATASLAIGPRPTPALRPLGFMFIVPVDQRLYAFNPRRADPQCSFEVLSSRAPRDEEDEHEPRRRAERWSVESVPAPMPLGKHEHVTAYAVHPGRRAIFVSARNWSRLPGERTEGTHSFDARASTWAWHGEWQLPFQGQGHFVDELDALVGLGRDGFLCSCDVPSGAAALPDLNLKMGKETLFREDPGRQIGQPTLTYMGGSRVYMIECAARRGIRKADAVDGQVDGCVLHVTVFGVRYDKRGDLQTTVHRSRSYLVSRYGPAFAPQTFWM